VLSSDRSLSVGHWANGQSWFMGSHQFVQDQFSRSYEGVEVNAAQVPIAVMQLGSLDPPRFPVKSNREQRVAVVEQAVLASLETWNIKRQVAR
jgi:hypothetical protein